MPNLAALAELPGVAWATQARNALRVLPGIVAKNRGDIVSAERYLGDLVAEQRDGARVPRTTQPFTLLAADWPGGQSHT